MSPAVSAAPTKSAQIAAHYRARIWRGDLIPGDGLPSEREVVREWRVSRPTAARALAALAAEGLIESRQGARSFVAVRPRNRSVRSRYALARATGQVRLPTERSTILAASVQPSPPHVAAGLGLAPDTSVVHRRRLWRDASGMTELADSWFPATIRRVAPLLLTCQHISEGSLAYVEAMTGRIAVRGREETSVVRVSPESAGLLELNTEKYVVQTRHVAYDHENHPLEYAQSERPVNRWVHIEHYDFPP